MRTSIEPCGRAESYSRTPPFANDYNVALDTTAGIPEVLAADDPARLRSARGRLTYRAALVELVGHEEPDGPRAGSGDRRAAAPPVVRPSQMSVQGGRRDRLRAAAHAHMVKLVFCLRRLPQLSRADFQRYWREKHGPLVRRHAAALRIRRYVQLHTREDALNDVLRASRGGPEPYDGIAELWWESRDDLEAATASPEGQRASLELLEDERRFIDLGRSPLWIADEHPVVG